MKTIQELAVESAITDTSTTQISEVQGKSWATEVVKFGEALRKFDQAVETNTYMIGKGDATVTIPKSTSHLAVDYAPADGEGGKRDNTELTNLDTVDLTISQSSFKRGVVTVSKQIALTSRIDLIKQARYTVAEALAQDVDTALATTLQDPDVSNVVYGGDATGVATLADGDIMTTDLVPDAMAKIEANNFVPKYLFLSAYQLKVFRKDPQFVNAAEYGSDRVVLKGEIGEYLGVSVITTTNCPTYAAGATDTDETPATWTPDGQACPMVGLNKAGRHVAAALAWKEKPAIGYEYEMNEAIHRIYYDQCFTSGVIQPGAISLVKVSQA